ncbi:MAG TPA: 6-phosphofructokinase, partial [Planctomycetes bacterium]|nr:6-phosphofructokinase [Planctomycetota bacterium]
MAKNPSERPVLAILVGGGPAPGINGVISAATIEAINRGLKVLGIREGFRYLAEGRADKMSELTIPDVSRIHFNGGSILFTSRVNPAKNEESMANVVRVLKERKVRYLVTIGGDDTAFSAVQVARRMEGELSVAHVPKTIDNDLPLPGFAPTFGYETARHVGVSLVKNLMEDARTTRRWVFVVSMGRQAGHLALGICLAAGATLAVIPEEFKEKGVGIDLVGRVLEGAILKRLAMDRYDGVAVIAEGILERLKPEEIHALREAARDEHGHIRLSEIDLASALKKKVT